MDLRFDSAPFGIPGGTSNPFMAIPKGSMLTVPSGGGKKDGTRPSLLLNAERSGIADISMTVGMLRTVEFQSEKLVGTW
jgi:hypothetical protein